jgi:hypothetical protein
MFPTKSPIDFLSQAMGSGIDLTYQETSGGN